MAHLTVITGPERRRRWSLDEKRAVVEAAFAPGAVVADIARRSDIQPGQIYRWRHELFGRRGMGGPSFAEVVVTPPRLDGADARAAAALIVELANGARVHIGGSASPALVTAALRALSK
jgi:transposase